MSKGSKKKDESKSKKPKKVLSPLTQISGIGPKTLENLISSGYDTLEKVTEAKSEKLAEAISGLSVSMAEDVIERARIVFCPLTHIPGVGPKTAEKLTSSGYDDLEKVAKGKAAEIAAKISGLSVSKSKGVIDEAKKLIKDIKASKVVYRKKRTRRRRKREPDPEKHELPPAEEMEQTEEVTKLETGLEKENQKKGIPIGPKWLTKFERARIVGARALQISMGAPILVSKEKAKGLFSLADAELKNGRLPMTVRRTLPTGEYHDIPLSVLLKGTRLD